MLTRSLSLKDEVINYKIFYKNKKNISIRLNGNKEILVYSPYGISTEYIEKLLIKKENWIISNMKILNDSNLNNDRNILFRGERLVKNIYKSNGDEIILSEDSILIKSKYLDNNYIDRLLYDWYIKMANKIITDRTSLISIKNNLIPSKVIIKDQKSRWGSCNSKKEIRLNWRLILMPDYVMDYIIVHELCHLKHMNHSSDFWSLVHELKPDFKSAQIWLKDNGLSLF